MTLFHSIWSVPQKKTATSNVELTGRSGNEGICIRNTPYRVDSELGRFTFDTHEVVSDERVVYKSTELFPAQRGKAYYLTRGFREIGMLSGATDTSYRKTTKRLNRQRRQESGGTPLTTLRDSTEAEGAKVLDFWAVKTDSVLEAMGVDESHPPTPELCGPPKRIVKESQAGKAEVRKALVEAEIPEELQDEVKANPVPYERQEQSVNICSDGVLAKKQREKRRRPGATESPVESSDKKTSKRLNHKTATIEHDGKRYTLVAATYVNLFRTILAFVLNNGLQYLRLCFFTDGEKSLKNALVDAFSWHPAIFVILDWHHIEKKCAERLSMACRGRKLRNKHLEQVTRLLWYGATQSAIDYLRQIPASHIKAPAYIDKLCAYLGDRRTMIPCYAIRKRLGLRNSSNAVEKANDQLVSSRQKHQGMSWSEEGSLALAALSATVKNRHQRPWLKGRVLPFTLDPKNDEAAQRLMAEVA